MNTEDHLLTACNDIASEVRRAQRKFPRNRHLTVALMEEVGELAQAQLQGKPYTEIRKEAVQVCAVAVRIILEGDADLVGANEDDVEVETVDEPLGFYNGKPTSGRIGSLYDDGRTD